MQIIHISDLHMKLDSPENHRRVLHALFEDWRREPPKEDAIVVFSGDFVQSGFDMDLYDEFDKQFLRPAASFGLTNERFVFVPGNHDVDASYTRQHLDTNYGLLFSLSSETQANNFLRSSDRSIITEKFSNYRVFEALSAKYGCNGEFLGDGYAMSEDVGLYCLNTSLFSLGGNKTPDGGVFSDEGKLIIDTRGISEWLQTTSFRRRILVMHHPLNWLNEWSRRDLEALLRSNFDVCFHGHIHDSTIDVLRGADGGCAVVSAAPLFTRKSEILGYSKVELGEDRVTVVYKQWTAKHGNFVLGTHFSGNNSGTLEAPLRPRARDSIAAARPATEERTRSYEMLDLAFKAALQCYSPMRPLWVCPDLGDVSEKSRDLKQAVVRSAQDVAKTRSNLVVTAPPQHGLSSLGRFLAREKFANGSADMPVVYDAITAPNHETGITEFLASLVQKQLGIKGHPDCVIIDKFNLTDDLHTRQVNSIVKSLPSTQLILLSTVDDPEKLDTKISPKIAATFEHLALWSLSRAKIRELVHQQVSAGNSKLHEDQTVARLTEHLETLNLPRTAHNCLTLLTIFNHQIEANPVNRTELIETFLQILFSTMQGLPKYSTIPDLKDSLFALGYLCDFLVRRSEFEFTRSEFYEIVGRYCREQMVDIQIDTLFLMLCASNLLLERGQRYSFRFAYWVHFFSAHRMHHSVEFYDHLMKDRRYARFPEVIEFYSGIDRRSTKLIDTLLNDLTTLNAEVLERTELSDEFDPYSFITWSPDEAEFEEIKTAIADEAGTSNLPVEVRDAIADRSYDRTKPYRQRIETFLDTSSVLLSVQLMRASARALRNSDHADPDRRRSLLGAIMLTWSRIVRVLLVLSPVLVADGKGGLHGLNFFLNSSFDGMVPDEKWQHLVESIPFNVVNYYGGELASAKMGPLYFEYLDSEAPQIGRHLMAVHVARAKPRGWMVELQEYINSLPKDSFYLSDMASELKRDFDYGFVSIDEKIELRKLIGQSYGRHFTGAKQPNRGLVEKYASHVLGENMKQ